MGTSHGWVPVNTHSTPVRVYFGGQAVGSSQDSLKCNNGAHILQHGSGAHTDHATCDHDPVYDQKHEVEADAPATTSSRRRTRVDHTRHVGTHDHAEETVANGTLVSTSMTSTHSARRRRKMVLVCPADHAQHVNVRAAEHGRERAEKYTWVST